MKRIANYRSGDRAEALGVVLMQMFCAIAPVPRQEDFGIVDAVATLLRRDGRLLYAEDSFSVQFKSKSVKQVAYVDERFHALLSQELGLFIAHVNLSKKDMRLYSVGAALSIPNISHLRGVAVHLHRVPPRTRKGVLHVSLGDPVLQWSMADVDDLDAETNAYHVMKKWLELDRWNRRYRGMGMQIGVRWQTNQIPTRSSTVVSASRHGGDVPLAEITPVVRWLGWLATVNPELAAPVTRIMSWMRSRGADPDADGLLSTLIGFQRCREHIQNELRNSGRGEIGVCVESVVNEPGRYVLLVCSSGVSGPSTERRHECSDLQELRALGLDAEIDPETSRIITVGLGADWLLQRSCELLGVSNDVFLLRKTQCENLGDELSIRR